MLQGFLFHCYALICGELFSGGGGMGAAPAEDEEENEDGEERGERRGWGG